ncbi:hypothetical protein AWC38_SpisGene24487, partial [Stylophora pistillata]
MISTAFWSVNGSEIKITRSDDPSHPPLLQTTGNCLGGQAFRSKITSYGDFRNGTVWASDQCLGSCSVQYGGQYKSTDGFQQAKCNGNIQSADKIDFWCDWDAGDGSVMMIGGGGSSCARANHGIGITVTGSSSFVDLGTSQTEYDFGGDSLLLANGDVPMNGTALSLLDLLKYEGAFLIELLEWIAQFWAFEGYLLQVSSQFRSLFKLKQTECNGSLQSANKIGLWCDWSDGDGSVMMTETKVVYVQGKPFSQGTNKRMAYVNFERHKFPGRKLGKVLLPPRKKVSMYQLALSEPWEMRSTVREEQLRILTSAVLPFGLVTLMETAITITAPTAVPVKVDLIGMEKHALQHLKTNVCFTNSALSRGQYHFRLRNLNVGMIISSEFKDITGADP